MTRVDFYSNASDTLATACRIIAKGYALKNRFVVLCPDAETAQRIDRMLWTSPATGFIPHCGPADALAPVTPVIIDQQGNEPVHDQVLINLRDEWPAHFGRFERLVEIVTGNEDDKALARSRFRFYRDRGYQLNNHDLSETEGAA